MADLGNIGKVLVGLDTPAIVSQLTTPIFRGSSYLGGPDDFLQVLRVRDDLSGNPGTAMKQTRFGSIGPFMLPLAQGNRTVRIDHSPSHDETPRARIVIRPPIESGLSGEIIVNAVAGMGFQTLTATFTTLGSAVHLLFLEHMNKKADSSSLWDNLRVV